MAGMNGRKPGRSSEATAMETHNTVLLRVAWTAAGKLAPHLSA